MKGMPKDTLQSKFGRKFRIVQIARAREGEVAFLSYDEWAWVRAQKLSSEEFDRVLRERYQDHRSRIIPARVEEEKKDLTRTYCGAILEDLKKRGVG